MTPSSWQWQGAGQAAGPGLGWGALGETQSVAHSHSAHSPGARGIVAAGAAPSQGPPRGLCWGAAAGRGDGVVRVAQASPNASLLRFTGWAWQGRETQAEEESRKRLRCGSLPFPPSFELAGIPPRKEKSSEDPKDSEQSQPVSEQPALVWNQVPGPPAGTAMGSHGMGPGRGPQPFL